MCSLETFVADRVLWQESFFLASAERSLYKEERNDMNFLNAFVGLFSNFGNLTWQMAVMWGIGALLIYLAIAKKMEPSLLLPIMAAGMAGTVLVIGVIVLAVMLLNKLTRKK